MLLIGERINTSREEIEPAVKERDEEFILQEARIQLEAGADLIDVNAGTLVKGEAEALEWLVKLVQGEFDGVRLSLDTPNTRALEAALKKHEGKAMINSISLEEERLESMLPLVKDYGCSVIALCMDDEGMPETAEDRCRIASELVEKLTGEGVEMDDIYIDPLIRPISTGPDYGQVALETIRFVKEEFEEVHVTCGLSNISFGLPLRQLLNQTFLVMCMTEGLDSAILDPTDRKLMSLLRACEALLGRDEYGMNYITLERKGELTV